MAAQTHGTQVLRVIAAIGVNVMDFEVIHITLSPLGLVSANCASVVITLKNLDAVVEVGNTILPFIPA